jgi:hypothetical protein
MLTTKTVGGEPITVDGNQLIPLVSVGFGLRVGAGEAADAYRGTGSGGEVVGSGTGGHTPLSLVSHPCDLVGSAVAEGTQRSLSTTFGVGHGIALR